MIDIPLEVCEHVFKGKPASEYVMKRQSVTTNKKTGVVNHAINYAKVAMNRPAHPLEIFQHIITVSLETQFIVNDLPRHCRSKPKLIVTFWLDHLDGAGHV